ncbi:MAG: hypothetical protein HY660_09260 [Armatimonadetes bacterium]|nr:hypothetical protein [Armatimonadota bacterium]
MSTVLTRRQWLARSARVLAGAGAAAWVPAWMCAPAGAQARFSGAVPAVLYLGMGVQLTPFTDPRLRRAVASAVNREEVLRLFGRDFRDARAAMGIQPPGLPAHNPSAQPLPYDVDRAKALLAEAGFGAGQAPPAVELWTSAGRARVAEAVRADLVKVGFTITVRSLANFSDLVRLVRGGAARLFLIGWVADTPQDIFADILFHSTSQANHTRYANPEVDRLLREAAQAADPERKVKAYQEAERLIVQDAPVVPLLFYTVAVR